MNRNTVDRAIRCDTDRSAFVYEERGLLFLLIKYWYPDILFTVHIKLGNIFA